MFSLIFVFGLFSLNVFPGQFRFKNFNTSNGLPSNTIRCIMQDQRGFIWIGTENGISRFDGSSFKTFRNIPGDTASIGSSYINLIFEDSRNVFWIGTESGIYLYHPETETFSFFDKNTKDNLQITSNTTRIEEDRSGGIWFGTEGQGLFFYNQETGILHQFTPEPEIQNASLSSDFILSLLFDSKGNLWVSTKTPGKPLHRFDKATNSFLPFHIKDIPQSSLIYAIEEDSNGYLWLGTWENGISRFNVNDGSVKTFVSPKSKGGISHVHSILEYKPEVLLIGSDDGLLEFNTNTAEQSLMKYSELRPEGLSDKFIYPVFKDREGGLWVGSYYKGLDYAAPDKGYIESFTHSEYKNSVGGNVISCFCEDKSGNIWIGSDDGGLSFFDTGTKQFTNYMPVPGQNSLSYHNVHALLLDEGKLWIGTYSGGLNVLDLKSGRFTLFMPAANHQSIDGSSIYSLFKDREGDIWAGTMQGLNRYNKKTRAFSRILTTKATTRDIVQEKDGTMWFATWGGGLYRYKPGENEWKHYSTKGKATIPHNSVLCLCIDPNGRLWIGTDNGLCYYDNENDTFVPEAPDIPSLSINNIISYNNILWLSTANGFVSYSPASKETKVFTTGDGLRNDQFTIKGSMLSSNGRMYLGTTDGFSIMRPETFSRNEYIPPVVITNLQVFNKDLKIGKDEILKKSTGATKEIALTYKQNVLSIEYAALSYSVPGKNTYKYILEGFDKDWNYVGNQRKATYTNLPSGKFVFRVMGSNNDGIWNEKETTLIIRVLPPFWRSSRAYLFYILLFGTAISYLFFVLRKRAERKNKMRIKKLHAEKEKELHEAKINFFTQVAHEIRTPVSLIIGPLEKILEQSPAFAPAIQDDLNIINRNSQRLLALVDQLLDFRKVEQGGFKPHFSSHNIYSLLQYIYDRFAPLIVKKGIRFEFIANNKDLTATVDAEAYTKIVSNLLTNASKYAKTKILIELTDDDHSFLLNVIDDGDGICENEFHNIFKPFYQVTENYKPGTGIGLSLVQLLVEAHHGMIDISSIPGRTCFTVSLPLTQDSIPADLKQNTSLPEINDYPILFDEEVKNAPYTPETNSPTLLIVEDNTELCNFLHNRLRHSYTILIAYNGQEGLDILKKQPADIIISDIMMPVMDGIRFCKEVKTNLLFSHIPLILLTAKTENNTKVESMQTGADAYIEKPFSVQLLKAQIENLLNSRKLLRKKFSEMPFMALECIAFNKADEAFLLRLNGIIEKNISNTDFSIDILAEELFISRSGLFAKIKTLAGMTPNELIHLVRLRKAAELLITKEYRINEICYMAGFNNPSYFSKCFQKQFGVLPKDFINKQYINTTS